MPTPPSQVVRQKSTTARDELRSALRRLLPDALAEGEIPVRLAGELQVAGALCDIVALLAQTGRSGTLVVSSADATRTIAIDSGELIGAGSTADHEHIGEILFLSGEISRDDVDEAVMIAALEGRLLGQVLVSLGFVTQRTVETMLARQAEEIFCAALRVEDGAFCFVDEQLDVPRNATARPTLLSMLLEAARRMDEMLVYRESVGSARHIPSKLPPAHDETLTPELALIHELCDGELSVGEIGRKAGLLEFEVTHAMHELVTKGRVEVLGPRVRSPEDIVNVFNDALIEVHRRCDRIRSGGELRSALERYAAASPEVATLLRHLSPRDDGSLDCVQVLRNAGPTRTDARIRRALGSYVDFAIFHAGSLLPCHVAAELPALTSRILEPLQSEFPPPARSEPPPLMAASG